MCEGCVSALAQGVEESQLSGEMDEMDGGCGARTRDHIGRVGMGLAQLQARREMAMGQLDTLSCNTEQGV